jgi:hypothetical protein
VSELVSFSLSLKFSTGAIFPFAGEFLAPYGKNLRQKDDVAHTYFNELELGSSGCCTGLCCTPIAPHVLYAITNLLRNIFARVEGHFAWLSRSRESNRHEVVHEVHLGSGLGLPLWRRKLIFATFRLEGASNGGSDQ